MSYEQGVHLRLRPKFLLHSNYGIFEDLRNKSFVLDLLLMGIIYETDLMFKIRT